MKILIITVYFYSYGKVRSNYVLILFIRLYVIHPETIEHNQNLIFTEWVELGRMYCNAWFCIFFMSDQETHLLTCYK